MDKITTIYKIADLVNQDGVTVKIAPDKTPVVGSLAFASPLHTAERSYIIIDSRASLYVFYFSEIVHVDPVGKTIYLYDPEAVSYTLTVTLEARSAGAHENEINRLYTWRREVSETDREDAEDWFQDVVSDAHSLSPGTRVL